MKHKRLIALIGLALLLAACGASFAQRAGMTAAAPTAAPAAEAPGAPAMSGGASALEGYNSGSNVPAKQTDAQAPERLVIKTADISLQVASARDAEAQLRALVGQLGGYVVKVETTGADEQMASRVIFRVPAERFEQALTGAQGLAQKVLARTVGGDDVTEEFVDLDSRLRNLEATRDRLLAFLQKAESVEDALKVNDSLTQIQGEIEQIQGRRQFLQRSAALATISVYLSPVPTTPILAEDGWQPIVVARGALHDLLAFGQGLANLAIVVLVWLPVWLPLLLAALWFGRRRRRRGQAAPPSTPEAA